MRRYVQAWYMTIVIVCLLMTICLFVFASKCVTFTIYGSRWFYVYVLLRINSGFSSSWVLFQHKSVFASHSPAVGAASISLKWHLRLPPWAPLWLSLQTLHPAHSTFQGAPLVCVPLQRWVFLPPSASRPREPFHWLTGALLRLRSRRG